MKPFSHWIFDFQVLHKFLYNFQTTKLCCNMQHRVSNPSALAGLATPPQWQSLLVQQQVSKLCCYMHERCSIPLTLASGFLSWLRCSTYILTSSRLHSLADWCIPLREYPHYSLIPVFFTLHEWVPFELIRFWNCIHRIKGIANTYVHELCNPL